MASWCTSISCSPSTPITALPDDLHVGGDLDLRGTRVTRLPPGMHVGGTIFPNSGLHDLQAFARTLRGGVALHLHGTTHNVLRVRAQLQDFPDLWRIVRSLDPGRAVGLRRNGLGAYMYRYEDART